MAIIEAGDLPAYIRAAGTSRRSISIHIEAVHRLSDLGAVVTHAARGTSQEGFDAEWRKIDTSHSRRRPDQPLRDVRRGRPRRRARAVRGTAAAQTPRLENAASRVVERFQACFAARDWDAMAEILAGDFFIEDRRRVVNPGSARSRCPNREHAGRTEVGVRPYASTVIATRGQRLALESYPCFGQRLSARRVPHRDARRRRDRRRRADRRPSSFDADDIDAAFEELDARYLAGEAAAHAHTWSVISQAYAALNRTSSRDDAGLGEHRPSARYAIRARVPDPIPSVPRWTSRRTSASTSWPCIG